MDPDPFGTATSGPHGRHGARDIAAIVEATAIEPTAAISADGASHYTTPVANAPLITHVIAELAAGGITAASVVGSPDTRRLVSDALGTGERCRIAIAYVETTGDDPRHAVLAELGRKLAVGPVLVHPGDCLLGGLLGVMVDRFAAGDHDAILPGQVSAHRFRDRRDRASGLPILLGSGMLPLIQELADGADGSDLVGAVVNSNSRVLSCADIECWRYDESTEGLLAANRLLLDELKVTPMPEALLEGNRIQGRVVIAPGAAASNCLIQGPAAIAAGAMLEDAFIGPYSAIGPDAVVSGAEIENAMVLAAAEIRHPGSRIEGSIIGERCRVERSFELPQGLHVRLSPGSRLTLS